MEIDLDMVVGGPQLDNTFSLDQINNWTCPSFIVDYVRAYHRPDSSNSNFTLADSSKSSKDICALAKALNSINNTDGSDNHQEEVSPVTSTSFPTLIILSIVPVILILMAIIVYLLLRVKKHKNKISQAKQNVEDNFYSDIKEDYEPGLYDQY